MLRTLKNTWRKVFQRIPAQEASRPRGLDHQISEVDSQKQSVLVELQRVQGEIDSFKTRDAELAALNERIVAMDAAGEAASREIAELRDDIADAAARQEKTDNQIRLLREQQETERREHQTYVQESMAREHRQNRRLGWSLLLACCALLLGTLAGTATFRDGRQYAGLLAELSRDIKDIKVSLDQQLSSMRQSLEGYQLSQFDEQTVGQAPDSQSGLARKPEKQPDRQQAESAAAVPTYGFHPHNKYRTRSEMRAFFAENARDLGVVTLDSGLQYKVLSHGNGRSPGATDRVVYDYRAFLADGTEISNSYQEAEPQASRIDELRPGLQEALLQMNEGAQWELYIPPGLAYTGVRRRGMGDRAFEPLIYIVELKSVIEGGDASKEN